LDQNGIFRLSSPEQKLTPEEEAEFARSFYCGCFGLALLFIFYVYLKMHFHVPVVESVDLLGGDSFDSVGLEDHSAIESAVSHEL